MALPTFHSLKHGYRSTRILRCTIRRALCLLAVLISTSSQALTLTGDFWTHDPSRITQCNGKYFVYCTGPDCQMRYSTDLRHWTVGPAVLDAVPQWAHDAVPGNPGEWIWAPDVIFYNHQYYLFYSFSTFGSKVSAIGLVTSPALDPDSPGYHWTDRGEVVGSNVSNDYNAIDPCPIIDAKGDLWLSFGSWNRGGIELIRLDDKTAKATTHPQSLASGFHRLGPEASFIAYHAGYYYLWDNEGWCCQGMNSTYHILIGRSRTITGPYVDKAGAPLLGSGGSVFLRTDGAEFGPGCMGLSSINGTEYASYHYYSGVANGRPTLGIERLKWAKDGWPYIAFDSTNAQSAQSGSIAAGGHFTVVSSSSNLALSVQSPGDRDGSAVQQAPAAPDPLQEWNISPTGDGYYSIASLATGAFVDQSATGIDEARWSNSDSEKWTIEQVGTNAYKIVDKLTGQALTSTQAEPVTAATPGQPNQTWLIEPVITTNLKIH